MISTSEDTQVKEFPLPAEILDIAAAGFPGAGWLTRNKTDLFLCCGVGIIALEVATDCVSEELQALFDAMKIAAWYGFDIPSVDDYEGEEDEEVNPTTIALSSNKPQPPVLRDLLVWGLESCHVAGMEAEPGRFTLRQPSASLINGKLLAAILSASCSGMHQIHYVEFSKLPAMLITRCGQRNPLPFRPRFVGLLLEMSMRTQGVE